MTNIVNAVKNELTFDKVLMNAMKTPGVKINRASFLKKELIRYCSEEQIEEAINSNPAKAGIPKSLINKVADSVINLETTKVTGISVAASLPGGALAVGAATADIVSYFSFILRAVQELAYLYGFEQFDLNDDSVDSETMQEVLVFIGVMFGVQGAAAMLKKLSDALSRQIAKKLAQKALTKTVYYPIVKKVASKVGIHMTKQIFADTVASAIPLVGGALSGGLTYAMFKPCCVRLKNTLKHYNLCDPEYYKNLKDENIVDAEIEESADDDLDIESLN